MAENLTHDTTITRIKRKAYLENRFDELSENIDVLSKTVTRLSLSYENIKKHYEEEISVAGNSLKKLREKMDNILLLKDNDTMHDTPLFQQLQHSAKVAKDLEEWKDKCDQVHSILSARVDGLNAMIEEEIYIDESVKPA